MANREENLKKINEELEKLSDDELEKVAGSAMVEFESNDKTNLNQNSLLQAKVPKYQPGVIIG